MSWTKNLSEPGAIFDNKGLMILGFLIFPAFGLFAMRDVHFANPNFFESDIARWCLIIGSWIIGFTSIITLIVRYAKRKKS